MTGTQTYREVFPDWADALDSLIPEHMRSGLELYILYGVEPGNFLKTLLRGDFYGMMILADPINSHRLYDYFLFLRWSAPGACYGSEARVETWIAEGGFCRHMKAESTG